VIHRHRPAAAAAPPGCVRHPGAVHHDHDEPDDRGLAFDLATATGGVTDGVVATLTVDV
jgi:hypothetical protein